MGYQSNMYVGAYLEVSPVKVEKFTQVPSCTDTCNKGKVGQKFCPECGAPVVVTPVSAGFEDETVSMPDGMDNLLFCPPNGIEDSPINVWLPNMRDSGWSLSNKKAVNFDEAAIEKCKNALLDSKSGRAAMDYLNKHNIEFKVCFGALSYYF